MRFFKNTFILVLSFGILMVVFLEFRKQTDLKPKIELVANKDWHLTQAQVQEFEKINMNFSNQASIGNFVTEFTSVFKSLSKLYFLEDARWAWDHNHPLKIKAYVSQPKFMMFKNNYWFLVNQKGDVLRKVSQSQTLDLPIFRSESLLKNKDLKLKSFKILAAFEDSNSSIPLSAVSEVNSDSRGISVILSEGFKVYLSDKNTDRQINRVSNVIAFLKKENISPEFIDAQLAQKILVRPQVKLQTKKD